MKTTRRIDNVRKAKNDAEALQRYIAEIDWHNLYEVREGFYFAGAGVPMPSEIIEAYELALAVVSHPNVSCATVKQIWEQASDICLPWPLFYVCEMAKYITHEEVLREICRDMYVNAYLWDEEYWETVRAVMQEKATIYAECFKKLKYRPGGFLEYGWQAYFKWPEGFFPDTVK